MLYKFIDIPKTRIEDAFKVGKISTCHQYIELPDNFDFSGDNPSPVMHKINIIKDIPVVIPEPTLIELANNFIEALGKWSKAGYKITTKDEYNKRSEICNNCEYWDKDARMGLGKCNVPGCGCTKLKRWLTTEKCPKRKWK